MTTVTLTLPLEQAQLLHELAENGYYSAQERVPRSVEPEYYAKADLVLEELNAAIFSVEAPE